MQSTSLTCKKLFSINFRQPNVTTSGKYFVLKVKKRKFIFTFKISKTDILVGHVFPANSILFTTWNFCSRYPALKNQTVAECFLKTRYLVGWQFSISDPVAYLKQDFACRSSLRPPATSMPFTTWTFRSRLISIHCVRRSGTGMEFAANSLKIPVIWLG